MSVRISPARAISPSSMSAAATSASRIRVSASSATCRRSSHNRQVRGENRSGRPSAVGIEDAAHRREQHGEPVPGLGRVVVGPEGLAQPGPGRGRPRRPARILTRCAPAGNATRAGDLGAVGPHPEATEHRDLDLVRGAGDETGAPLTLRTPAAAARGPRPSPATGRSRRRRERPSAARPAPRVAVRPRPTRWSAAASSSGPRRAARRRPPPAPVLPPAGRARRIAGARPPGPRAALARARSPAARPPGRPRSGRPGAGRRTPASSPPRRLCARARVPGQSPKSVDPGQAGQGRHQDLRLAGPRGRARRPPGSGGGLARRARRHGRSPRGRAARGRCARPEAAAEGDRASEVPTRLVVLPEVGERLREVVQGGGPAAGSVTGVRRLQRGPGSGGPRRTSRRRAGGRRG